MKTSNLFEQAVSAGETDDFFRGSGIYFVRSPDYDGHVHGANLGGHVESYTKLGQDQRQIFRDCFIKFLATLEENETDLEHLLGNLSAYFGLKRTGFLQSSECR